ncbi:hypothetical protein F4X90_07125 [Candidatus Poribacteria bacterium]|nr:hypothetical protein [Candidatus Poribacteria bacterium]
MQGLIQWLKTTNVQLYDLCKASFEFIAYGLSLGVIVSIPVGIVVGATFAARYIYKEWKSGRL